MTHFKKGDSVVVFDPREPEKIQTSKIIAVSRVTYGTPKVKLRGSLKFDWWADGTCCEYFNGGRKLLPPEDVPKAQAAARLRLERDALVREIAALFVSADRDVRRALNSFRGVPDFAGVQQVADQLQIKLHTLLQRALALTAKQGE